MKKSTQLIEDLRKTLAGEAGAASAAVDSMQSITSTTILNLENLRKEQLAFIRKNFDAKAKALDTEAQAESANVNLLFDQLIAQAQSHLATLQSFVDSHILGGEVPSVEYPSPNLKVVGNGE